VQFKGTPSSVLGALWQLAQPFVLFLKTASFARCCQSAGAPQGAPAFILHT
jgi:ABC-type polysaccharide/polyol phosphate export permease